MNDTLDTLDAEPEELKPEPSVKAAAKPKSKAKAKAKPKRKKHASAASRTTQEMLTLEPRKYWKEMMRQAKRGRGHEAKAMLPSQNLDRI